MGCLLVLFFWFGLGLVFFWLFFFVLLLFMTSSLECALLKYCCGQQHLLSTTAEPVSASYVFSQASWLSWLTRLVAHLLLSLSETSRYTLPTPAVGLGNRGAPTPFTAKSLVTLQSYKCCCWGKLMNYNSSTFGPCSLTMQIIPVLQIPTLTVSPHAHLYVHTCTHHNPGMKNSIPV